MDFLVFIFGTTILSSYNSIQNLTKYSRSKILKQQFFNNFSTKDHSFLKFLYFLKIYNDLHLKTPKPFIKKDTNFLLEHDYASVFTEELKEITEERKSPILRKRGKKYKAKKYYTPFPLSKKILQFEVQNCYPGSVLKTNTRLLKPFIWHNKSLRLINLSLYINCLSFFLLTQVLLSCNLILFLNKFFLISIIKYGDYTSS